MIYDTIWLFGTCAIYALLVWVITTISSNYDDEEI